MIKKTSYIIPGMAAALMALTVTGCSEEQTLSAGEGTMFISARVNSDVKVESRAETDDELAASTIIWISNSDGVVRKYNGMGEVPAGGVKLLSGDYTVKAWAGKLEYASFESRWFEGEQDVTIASGDKKSVEVTCKIANVVSSVKYADNIDEMISDYTLTVSHKGGSLTFEGRDDRKGYFMMPEGVTTLDYVLTATGEGHEITKHGTIENVEPAHEYVLNVSATSPEEEATGGAFITIEVDDTMVEVNDEVLISVAPAIVGYGFDINSPVAGESGTIGRKSVYVSSASPLTHLTVSGAPGIAPLDFVTATSNVIDEVKGQGVFTEVTDVEDGQLTKIVFEENYTNSLANSDTPYVITISATDGKGKTTTAGLTLRISLAPVATNTPAEGDVSYTTAVLQAQVMKEVETAGFEYREKGAGDWTYVAGSAARSGFAAGQTYYATVTGLSVGVDYEYRAVSGPADNPAEYKAEPVEFSTSKGPQLPNCGMEDWYKNGKVLMPMANGAAEFWDSGNHGSSTMNKNITNNSSAKKHSGSFSAELKSQFVGIGSIGKFAAGNIFIGKYLETQGTDGVLGFGRPFEIPEGLKVSKVRLWMHYTPGTAEGKGAGSYVPAGTKDQGDIYVALFNGPDNNDADYSGVYGKIVRTKNQSQLFDPEAANVVAYSDYPITEATPGNDLMLVEIPLEYREGKGLPTMIAIVCSASRYGDYFQGGEGSLLYVDDFELVYEAL